MNQETRKFYNNNPFPKLSKLGRVCVPGDIFKIGSEIKNIPVTSNPSILIVGCGLVSTNLIAQMYPNAKIICAVDISDKTIELAKKNINSSLKSIINWFNIDIQDEAQLSNLPDIKFDWIHCTGVLHHLENPEIGLKNISKLLDENGIIRFQVYSKGARTWIEWLRKLLLSKNVEDMDQSKEILLALSKFHPFRHTIATYNQSYKRNIFNDSFLNPSVKTYYASGWYKMFNDANLNIYHWENLDKIDDYKELLPLSLQKEFETLSIDHKLALYEILGEWRSDFKGYACKTNNLTAYTDVFQSDKTNYYIEDTDDYSYPRYYLWQELKNGLHKLPLNASKDDLIGLIDNLSFREWLPGFAGFFHRLYWFASRDESRFLASNKLIFKEKQAILLEDFFDNTDQIFIPSPEKWPWKQWDNAFFAWEW